MKDIVPRGGGTGGRGGAGGTGGRGDGGQYDKSRPEKLEERNTGMICF